jgi:membrane protein DedA with SNARE-associated domain
MISMDTVLGLLERYKYLAMFGILFLCGLGLPLPEEVTLIASGLAVGWEIADFVYSSIACVIGILAGDAIIFALGRYRGRWLMQSRPMRWLLSPARQAKIEGLFARHGSKAVFFARFLAGIRIGVYAYAGQHGMGWVRFLFLDLLGAFISGPTSIAIGAWFARRIADPQEAAASARDVIHRGSHWIYLGLGLLVLLSIGHWLWGRRGARKRKTAAAALPAGVVVPPEVVSALGEPGPAAAERTPGRAAPPGAGPR